MADEREQSEWLTADELAARWKVDTSTIYRWRREGSIPTMRVGGIVRIHRSAVDAVEDKAKHQNTVAALKRVRRRFQGVPDRIGSLD